MVTWQPELVPFLRIVRRQNATMLQDTPKRIPPSPVEGHGVIRMGRNLLGALEAVKQPAVVVQTGQIQPLQRSHQRTEEPPGGKPSLEILEGHRAGDARAILEVH